MNSAPSSQVELDAARLLLAKMGIDPAELLAEPVARADMPTFSEYIPKVSEAVSGSTRRAYSSYWKRIDDRWGDRRIDEPTPTEIQQLAEEAQAQALVRRNSRGGRSAKENFIAATRCLYKHAVNDELIAETANPARKVSKPRRLPSTRRALPDASLVEINNAAATTGDDPELDTLLIRLHTETACRRGGALNLRPRDLDKAQCLIYLQCAAAAAAASASFAGLSGSAGFSGSAVGWRRMQEWWAARVFSTCSARLCHRCQRSATWIASGAPVRAPSA